MYSYDDRLPSNAEVEQARFLATDLRVVGGAVSNRACDFRKTSRERSRKVFAAPLQHGNAQGSARAAESGQSWDIRKKNERQESLRRSAYARALEDSSRRIAASAAKDRTLVSPLNAIAGRRRGSKQVTLPGGRRPLSYGLEPDGA
jgi:hypothetical protein